MLARFLEAEIKQKSTKYLKLHLKFLCHHFTYLKRAALQIFATITDFQEALG